jgi:hypothetical protein
MMEKETTNHKGRAAVARCHLWTVARPAGVNRLFSISFQETREAWLRKKWRFINLKRPVWRSWRACARPATRPGNSLRSRSSRDRRTGWPQARPPSRHHGRHWSHHWRYCRAHRRRIGLRSRQGMNATDPAQVGSRQSTEEAAVGHAHLEP